MEKATTVTVDARAYVDHDDCLTAAANDYVERHPEVAGWDLEPRWEDEQRERIVLTVPTFSLTP